MSSSPSPSVLLLYSRCFMHFYTFYSILGTPNGITPQSLECRRRLWDHFHHPPQYILKPKGKARELKKCIVNSCGQFGFSNSHKGTQRLREVCGVKGYKLLHENIRKRSICVLYNCSISSVQIQIGNWLNLTDLEDFGDSCYYKTILTLKQLVSGSIEIYI